ncbi:MAG: glycosyl hydrolase [Chloroflexota bacterium]|nr:glycosyl hydrolase [Chloroflexota bacterium]
MLDRDQATNRDSRQEMLDSLVWRPIGPHRGGRVVAVAGDVSARLVFYFGACAGGVWKTCDAGITWRNVSDGFFTTSAIGALAVSAANPNIIYAGTGETSIRNQVSHGDGVYKSADGGKTWTNLGLNDTRCIGKIQIHPTNPDLVYVAALGHAFGPNDERGVFRTKDGGTTWERILWRSADTGCHDISLDPTNPRVLYAAMWQVRRYPHALVSGGEECGLYRSTDGGDSWEEITRNPGLPAGVLGKAGVVASPARAGRVWALVEAEDGALFRSDDGGDQWIRLSEEPLLRTRPWYYMHVTADTQDANTVYVQNYGLWKSIDAGAMFEKMPVGHGDCHALWIDPIDNQRLIHGDDGGAEVSLNGGATWSSIYNQPTAQFYHVTTDNDFPYNVYGSQQDNTTLCLPSMTTDAAIHERTWEIPGGGESGYVGIKPDEPWHIVASGPAGRHAYNDIMTHYDRRTGQIRNITVWPELYGWGVGAESLKYRFNWTFPIMFSRHPPHDLYVCGNHVFRSSDLGGSFELASPDLTRNDPDKLKPSGGPLTRDNTGAEVYCTIFALAESPLAAGLLWAGSDDGLVHLSRDGGATWQNVTPPGLPEWALISIIDASPHEAGAAYVAATRYKLDDTAPYLYKTDDYGASWTKITGGIPAHEFTRVICEDPNRRGLLYAGTETGLYVSFNDGAGWQRLGGNLPVTPIYDLTIKGLDLIVATHGRSFWILDDLGPLHEQRDEIRDASIHLFQPKPAVRLRRFRPLSDDPTTQGVVNYAHSGASQILYQVAARADGETETLIFNAGTNPPDGLVVRYYLRHEPDSTLRVSFLDGDGATIREYSTADDVAGEAPPAKAGVNRFVWNLRYPGPATVDAGDLQPRERDHGPLAVPGVYQVRLTVGDEERTVPFEVQLDPRVGTSAGDLVAQRDFLLDVRDRLSQNNQLLNRVDALRGQIAAWSERTREPAITARLDELSEALDAMRSELIDVHWAGPQLWPTGLHEKLNALLESADGADFAPPRQARDVLAQLGRHLDELHARFDNLNHTRVAALNDAIRAANLPFVGVD